MRRLLMLSAIATLSAVFIGCESTRPCEDGSCTVSDATTQPGVDAALTNTTRTRLVALPPETVGSILDRSSWAKTETTVPVGLVPHFPVMFRDFESPTQKRLRKDAMDETGNETPDEQIDRAMDGSRARNLSRENVKYAAVQPLKFLYDTAAFWFVLPVDLQHGVPQTPDPVSDKIRQEDCPFYP